MEKDTQEQILQKLYMKSKKQEEEIALLSRALVSLKISNSFNPNACIFVHKGLENERYVDVDRCQSTKT